MLAIKKLVKSRLPAIDWQKIAETILGPDYELSLVFVGNKLSQKLNHEHRGKNKPTNILSFSLEKKAGEIFLNPAVAKEEARLFNETVKNRLIYLFIHGLLHLKGWRHGSKMESKEKKLSKIFITLNEQTPYHRLRHRHSNHQSGGV